MTLTLPRPSDLFKGLQATVLLMRLQWRTIRRPRTKVLIVGIILLGVVALLSISQTGQMIRFVASEEEGIAQQYALSYLSAFMRGELGAIGSSALGLCVMSALLSPFTGSVSTSIIPPRDLSGMSVTRWHRFADSVVSQVISSISVLQLLTLTALSSMLTLDGGRAPGILLTWAVWLLLICLAVISLWVAEFMFRKFGTKSRRLILFTAASVLSAALLIDPHHGSTLFGLGGLYADTVGNIGNMPTVAQIATIGGVLLGGVVALYIAAIFAAMSLKLPDVTAGSQTTVKAGRFKIPGQGVVSMMLRTIVRSSEIRKPLLSGTLLGIILTTLLPNTQAVSSTFAVVVPLVVALAWGSNALAHLGGGAVWLASLPGALKHTPWVLFTIQIALSLSIFTVIWLPSVLLGRASWDSVVANFFAVIASGVVVARSATHKSIHHPAATRFGSRAESTLSSSRALNYTLRFSLWGGQFGVIVLAVDNMLVRLGMCGAAIIWSLIRMGKIQEYWEDPEVKRKVVTTVAAD